MSRNEMEEKLRHFRNRLTIHQTTDMAKSNPCPVCDAINREITQLTQRLENMTTLAHHQREKLKERLTAFLKTTPTLVTDNQFDTLLQRLENCRLLIVEIAAMDLQRECGK